MTLAHAQLLVLRRRRGLLVLGAVPTLAVAAMVAVLAHLHASDPAENAAAGGTAGFLDQMSLLGALGAIVAVIIGIAAGTGDARSGVMRDHVAAGASRVALVAARVPAALALTTAALLPAVVVAALSAYALADGTPVDTATLARYAVGAIASGWVFAAVATGFGSAVLSSGPITGILLGWFLAIEGVVGALPFVPEDARALLLQRATGVLVGLSDGPPTVLAVVGIALWLAVALAAGTVRTLRREW